jgi:hypothetical protein
MTDEHRDALARVIDPDIWGLYDDARTVGRPFREDIVKESRATADRIIESGLMARLEWIPREYESARQRIMERTSRTGKCYEVEDMLDGYFMHDPKCAMWPKGATGGSGCIR